MADVEKPVLKDQGLHDVHKLVFLADAFPEKNIRKLVELFEVPPIVSNVAIWRAIDMGYIVINPETEKVEIASLPEKWEFGPDIEYLEQALIYTFARLARDESDMDENYLLNWLFGIPVQDQLIATKHLVATHVLATYTVENTTTLPASKKAKGKGKKGEVVKDVYTFWSLWDNAEQEWGRKQFEDQNRLDSKV